MKLLFSPKILTFSLKVPSMRATAGVQKIIGMAIGLKHHRVDYFPYWHRSNSILLGASAAVDGGLVKLWNYSYVDGRHVQKEMVSVPPGLILNCRLRWGVNTDILIWDENIKLDFSNVSIKAVKPSCIGYILRPYFETDRPENKVIPFAPTIWDVKCNGMEIKI
jgi:hypothetical protein